MELELLLLPIIYMILNRFRGSDYPEIEKKRIIFTILMGGIIAFHYAYASVYDLKFFLNFMMIVALFIFGEIWTWGKWIGIMITGKPQPNNHKNPFGIHAISNFLFDEVKNPKHYAGIALFLRGFLWWAPVLLPFVIFKNFNIIYYISLVFDLSFAFPLSIITAEEFCEREWLPKSILFLIEKGKNEGEMIWAYAEMIYGFLIGLCMISLFIIV